MKVFRNYLYSIGYQILNMIIPLITGPYTARVLGPTGIGINTYTFAVIQYFVLIGGLGIALYGNREMAYVKGNIKKMSLTFWEIQIIKITTVTLAYIAFIIYLLFTQKYQYFLALQSLYIVAAGFDISWLYEGLENFKITFTRNTLVRLISFILIIGLVKKRSDLYLYIIILAVSNLIGYMAMWPSISKIVTFVKVKDLKISRHFKGILFLFVPYLTLNIYPLINKTLLEHFDGVDSSGYYEKSDVIIRMALTFVTSVSLVLLPHAANAFSKFGINTIKKMLSKSFCITSLISFPLAFGIAAIAPKFGLFFYGNGFNPVGEAMFIESFAIIFMGWSSIMGNQFLIPAKQVNSYTNSVLFGSILNIIIDIPLIKLWGLNGAVIATVVSEAAISAYQFIIIKRQMNVEKWIPNIIKYLFASIIMFIIVYNISQRYVLNTVSFVLEIVLGALTYLVLVLILKPTGTKELYVLLNKLKAIFLRFV